jgi:t-SNARE complex subunit (syntaxin)
MLVHEQAMMIERIDAKTDESLLNLERAKTEVVKYHDSVTSNRNLAVKVFMVFVFFFAFYVVFLV